MPRWITSQMRPRRFGTPRAVQVEVATCNLDLRQPFGTAGNVRGLG